MKNEIIDLGITEQAIAVLKDKYSVVPDANTKEGYKEIKAIKSVLTPLWTGIEKERKLQVAEALAHQKGVNERAKFFTNELKAIWAPNEAAKKLVDDEEKRIEQEKLDAEKIRIYNIEQEIQRVKECKNLQYGESTSAIKKIISDLDKSFYLFNFEDFEEIARRELRISMEILESAFDASIKLEEERAKQEEIRIEQEERQAKMDAQQAEIDKANAIKEAEFKAKQDEIDAKVRAQQAEIDAENAKILRIKEDQDLAEKSAKEAADKIEAAAEKERLAEIEREKDKNHRGLINSAAVKLLVENGVSETSAKKCITLIAKNLIDNVKISY